MKSKRPAPKNTLALESERNYQGRQCRRQVIEEQIRQKRGNNEDNAQAKRPKMVKQDDNTPESTVEFLFDIASPSILKEICAEVMKDKIAGPRFREELLSRHDDIMTASILKAREEKLSIIAEAGRAIQAVRERAMENKCMCECEDWPGALFPQLRRIQALNNRDFRVGGPGMAWQALIKVSAFCIHDWDDGELRISGFGEEDCDEFHDEVDKLMLRICETQEQNLNFQWLREGSRKEDIRFLQEKVEKSNDGPCTYRYQRTLKFLDKFPALEASC
ncbi:hypothetical protein F5Y10DRAFT_244405 [Nemania abortiva]|nr:hypothetical protein F5Y10DRAFT_244405 [Nemania abortiva]